MVLELRKLSEDEKIKQQMEARADYESRMATARGAGYREGLEVGIEKGKINTLSNLVKQNIITKNIAIEQMGITAEEFEELMKSQK